MKEIWKPLYGYEEFYEVSNLGKIKSLRRNGKLLSLRKERLGYYTCFISDGITRKNVSIHRCVMLTFEPNNGHRKFVNHIDGDKSNNKLENLEWVTHSENIKHAYNTGLKIKTFGKNHHNSIKIDQFTLDGWFVKSYDSIVEACNFTNSYNSRITLCLKDFSKTTNGFKWKIANECYF